MTFRICYLRYAYMRLRGRIYFLPLSYQRFNLFNVHSLIKHFPHDTIRHGTDDDNEEMHKILKLPFTLCIL